MFSNQRRMKLYADKIEIVPGIIYLTIKESNKLRMYHDEILKYLKSQYQVNKVGFDGDTFQFHSTLFQDEEHLDLIQEIYKYIDQDHFLNQEFIINRIYLGISNIAKVCD